MSGWDDLEGVTPAPISTEDAERLLSGGSGLDEIEQLAEVRAVLAALRGPAEPGELAGLQDVLVAFGAPVAAAQLDPSSARTRPIIRKLLTGKALATIGVVTLVSAGAAAAGGVVPSPFSPAKPSAASTTVSVSDTEDSTDDTVAAGTTTTVEPTSSTEKVVDTDEVVSTDAPGTEAAPAIADVPDSMDGSNGQGPDVNGPAKFGLCNAFEARSKHDDSTTAATDANLPVPFQNLVEAAEAAGLTVADFCADAVPGGSETPEHSSAESATAPGHSDDNPSATAPGQSDDARGNSGGKHGKKAKP